MSRDLTDPDERLRYARHFAYNHSPLRPTAQHLALLRSAYWSWNDEEFGAATIDGKHPYGNGDVAGDLAEILPDLSEQDRIRAHCELPAVLAWICAHLPDHFGDTETGATP